MQPVEHGSAYRIEGQTYDILENRVFEFRLANVEIIPTGTATRESVQEDLKIFTCSRAPGQCTDHWRSSPGPSVESPKVKAYNLPIQRLEDWIKQISVTEIPWAQASRAVSSAQTCASCPQNIAWKTGCAPCVESIQKRLVRYKGDRKTPVDNQLQACRIFGHHNEIAVWMLNTMSTAKETPPEACWNK